MKSQPPKGLLLSRQSNFPYIFNMIYLDWAATAPPDPEVIRIQADTALKYPGNPSSPYLAGKKTKAALEEARGRCAAVLGCSPNQLAFTSGGTEANAIVISSRLLHREPGTICLSGLEHPGVAEPAAMLSRQGWTVKAVPPEADGRLSPKRLTAALHQYPHTHLVAVMGVNNEIGAIQPLRDLTAAVRNAEGRPIHIHADLVQAVGKIPINLGDLDIDSASFSAHKFRGPRGIGLLYHRNTQFDVLLKGGGQEHGVRPGTENIAAAVAMAAALERYGHPDPRIAKIGVQLLEGIAAIEGARVIPEARLRSSKICVPNIVAVSFPPVPGEVLARVLDESGYAVSTGSACSHNKKGGLPRSMRALGIPRDTAGGLIRISIGSTTSQEEIEAFLPTLESHLAILKTAAPRN